MVLIMIGIKFLTSFIDEPKQSLFHEDLSVSPAVIQWGLEFKKRLVYEKWVGFLEAPHVIFYEKITRK